VAGTLITAVDSNDWDALGALADITSNNYTNLKGTSMSAPVVSGLAALLIDVQESNGDPWTATEAEVLQIKKTILMTATESNRIGEKNWNGGNEPTVDSGNNPSLNRGPSDLVEGFGLVNADAAMEALTLEFDTAGPVQVSFGSQPTDRRAAAWYIDLTSGFEPSFDLVVPTGADFDLYLYEPDPDSNGRPVIAASSTATGDADERIIGYPAAVTGRFALVAKRVSGSGTATLTGSAGTPLIFTDGFENASTDRWSNTTP
jgi:subtilisin family serine protease